MNKKITILFFLACNFLFAVQEIPMINSNFFENADSYSESIEENNENREIISTTSYIVTQSGKTIQEFRPHNLIEIDNQILNPANRGNLAALYAQYYDALRAYLESVSYDSNIVFFLANEYMLLNDYERANRIFLQDNRDLKNVFGAATTYRFMAKNDEAIQKYSEAISLNSNFAESYLGRALANRNMDNYDSAINDLTTYINMSGREEGYTALGDIYFKLGRKKEALNIVSSGLSKYPNSQLLNKLYNNISKN